MNIIGIVVDTALNYLIPIQDCIEERFRQYQLLNFNMLIISLQRCDHQFIATIDQ